MKFIHQAVAGALGLALAVSALANPTDDAMHKLATESGCFACHSIEPGKAGPDGLKPVGPSWKEVAAQYAGKPGAQEFLTRIVLEGSSPYASHWQGKVSGLAMPPNAVAITEGNARMLVSWILSLKK